MKTLTHRQWNTDTLITDMKPYPLDRPVSLSIISWIPSIFENKNNNNKKKNCNRETSKNSHIC